MVAAATLLAALTMGIVTLLPALIPQLPPDPAAASWTAWHSPTASLLASARPLPGMWASPTAVFAAPPSPP